MFPIPPFHFSDRNRLNLEKTLSDFLASVGTFKNRLKKISWMFFR